MSAIDRVGTFKGLPTDWGVSETKKNGYPQFVLELKATHFYDEEKGEYVPWDTYDQTITAYLCLFTKKDGEWVELMNAKQVKATFGWDGQSFESLSNGNYGNTEIMFRVEENDFEGNVTLQVSWVDVADADPLRQLPKFDAAKLKGLTEKMGGALAAASTAAAPVTKVKRSKRAKPKAQPPTRVTPPTTPPAPATPAESFTETTVWDTIQELKDKDLDDSTVADVWVDELAKLGKSSDECTGADWAILQEAILTRIAKF